VPLIPAPPFPVSYFWSFYGHSYYQGNFGTHGPAGRADSIMRSLFGLAPIAETKNHAMVGARATWNGNSQGGWTRLIQNEKGNLVNPGYPDICYDGAFFLGWGINDLGNAGNTAQHNTAYQHALRTCISRCRAARVWDDGNAAFTYGTAGTGFAVQNFQWETSSGDSYHSATVTTTATISWTVPADYHGGPIVFCFLSKPGVLGATFTFGGTAGITGTVSTSNILPAASGAGRIPVVRRITTLTAANAGQTITIAATAIDGGGSADFLGAWIESPYPPPVLVANTPKLQALGYANYTFTYASSLTGTAVASTPATITLASGTTLGLPTAGSVTCPSAGGTVTISWTGGPGTTLNTLTGVTHAGGSGNYSSSTLTYAGPTDADVIAFNAVLPSLVAEFDAMVQIVDLDTAIGDDPVSLGTDGLHPSELGAARIADAFRVAAQRLNTTSAYGQASQMNVPNKALVPLYLPKLSGGWYTSPGCSIPGTAYTPVAQDMFAIPFTCTSQGEVWIKWSMETLGGTVGATVFMGIYDDRSTSGLPKHIYSAPCATAITLPTGAAVYNSPAAPTNGGLILGPDPGLYWLVVLFVTTGTGVTIRTVKGPSLIMPNLASTGGAATTVCGWKAAAAGTVLPASWPFPFDSGLNTMSDNCPMIGIQVN
jgi:hypothetical protein